MIAGQTVWFLPLISAGFGAVIGSVITVLSEWALTSIRESSQHKKNKRSQLIDWWKKLRLSVYRFDLLWTHWIEEEHPNFIETQPWLTELFVELLELRSTLGPCEIRSQIDEVTRELSRIQQLKMESMGQAAGAYKDFVTTCNKQLEILKTVADTFPDA